MTELLEAYSLSEIVVFFVLAAATIKCVIEFFDWSRDRLKNVFDREYHANEQKIEIDKKFNDTNEKIKNLETSQTNIATTLDKLNEKVDLLIASDMDDIKMDLTEKHHFYCYEQGWIDDHSLDCCLKRFKHYKDEGGNSFIEGFIKELKALPKVQPANRTSSRNTNTEE